MKYCQMLPRIVKVRTVSNVCSHDNVPDHSVGDDVQDEKDLGVNVSPVLNCCEFNS